MIPPEPALYTKTRIFIPKPTVSEKIIKLHFNPLQEFMHLLCHNFSTPLYIIFLRQVTNAKPLFSTSSLLMAGEMYVFVVVKRGILSHISNNIQKRLYDYVYWWCTRSNTENLRIEDIRVSCLRMNIVQLVTEL